MRKTLLIFTLFFVTCFASAQTPRISPLSDAHLARMKAGGSWKANTPASLRAELRFVTLQYIDETGKKHWGEMVVNRQIAQDVVEIFDSLYHAGYRIHRIALVDEYGANDEKSMEANNTSCFNFRFVTGSNTAISLHGRGLAIDINPLWNPYVKGNMVKPKGAKRTPAITTSDLAYRLFRAHGFTWGGSWRSMKDYQHFEKRK